MGEALGIDLRATACAAARWRKGTVEGCVLGEGTATATAADLGAVVAGQAVDAVTATATLLRAVADRACGGVPGGPVAVAHAPVPDDGPRTLADRAAAVAFGEMSGATSRAVFVVARPVAVAARVAAGGEGMRDGCVAVLDMGGDAVDVALVRVGRHGFDLAGPVRTLAAPDGDTDMAAHLGEAGAVLDEVMAGAGVGRDDICAARAVGDPVWLPQLAEQVRATSGLDVVVDPEPEVAAAMGAAILAAGPERRGRSLAGGVAILGPAAAPDVAPAPVTGSGVGAAAGQAAVQDGPGPTPGDALGRAVGDAAGGDGTGLRVGRLADPAATPDGPVGGAVGEAVGGGGTPGAAAGAAIGAGRRRIPGRRGRVLAGAGAALVALVAVVGAILAGGGGGGAGAGVETRADASDASDGSDGNDRPGSTAAPDSTTRPSASETTSAPPTTAPPGPPTTPAGGATGGPQTGSEATPVPGSPTPAPAPGDSSPGGPAGEPPPGDPPATAPTTPPDTSGPSITGLSVSPGVIDEDGFEFCVRPKTAQLGAVVSDPSGVQHVTVSWSGNGTSGTTSMAAVGGGWQATLGPVADSHRSVNDPPATITWSVTAVDGAGNSATVGGPALTVYGC